jgi:hypothetical protein
VAQNGVLELKTASKPGDNSSRPAPRAKKITQGYPAWISSSLARYERLHLFILRCSLILPQISSLVHPYHMHSSLSINPRGTHDQLATHLHALSGNENNPDAGPRALL